MISIHFETGLNWLYFANLGYSEYAHFDSVKNGTACKNTKLCRFFDIPSPKSHLVNDSNSFLMRLFAADGIVCRGKGNEKGDLTFQMFVPPPTMPALDKHAACFDPSMCHLSQHQCFPDTPDQTLSKRHGKKLSIFFTDQTLTKSLNLFENFPHRPNIIKEAWKYFQIIFVNINILKLFFSDQTSTKKFEHFPSSQCSPVLQAKHYEKAIMFEDFPPSQRSSGPQTKNIWNI